MRQAAVLLTILISVALGGLWPPRAAPVLAQTGPEPTVIQADDSGLTLVWQPPPVEVVTVEIDGTTYSQISLPGLFPLHWPGAPQLPTYGGLLGLPPTGEATLRITDLDLETESLPHPPLPAPSPQPVSFDEALSMGGGPMAIEPDAALYGTDALFPATPAELGQGQSVRGRRVARLTINPVRVNPVSREMTLIRRIRLEIRFDDSAAPDSLAAQSQADAFTRALETTLLNPQAAQWQQPPAPTAIEPSPLLEIADSSDLLKVVVSQTGLYAVTYAELQAAGWPVDSLNPQTIQLSYGADFAPVSILVEGEVDASFDPGDRLLFFANPTFSRYTDEDVYFLSYAATSPPRMATRSGDPQGLPAGTAWRTATAESNTIYEPGHEGYNGDRWYWKKLAQPGASLNATISLSSPDTAGPNATFVAWLQGYTTGDHTVKVRINGHLAGTIAWSGKTQKQGQLAVPTGWLQNGSNAINLEMTSQGGVLVDAVELRYPTAGGGSGQLLFAGETGPQAYSLGGWTSNQLRVWDVTAPLTPTRVVSVSFTAGSLSVGDADASQRDYLVTPESAIKTPLRLEAAHLLSNPAGGADMIIITHPHFAAAVASLATHRAGQGLRVVTVDVYAVYDSFGGGRMSPQGIRAFLEHAYHQWESPSPLYVLLVGDGAYDFKNYSGFNPQNFIPPNLAQVDPWLGETASDNRLVNFDGGNLPSMFIGRLPVNSAAQAETVINKIIQYDVNPWPGGWNTRHLFVAGDECCGVSPSAATLQSHAEDGVARLPANGVGYRYYFDDTGATGDQVYIYTDYVQLRNNFIVSFNQGASTVVFHGHSSVHQWNDEPLLRWSFVPADHDVGKLVNGNRLPVVLSLTCFTGSFHHPEYSTLDESLLMRSGGGAVAAWGSTGLGVATGHELLQRGFYTSISGQDTNLGAAVFAGKLTLYNQSLFDRDLIDTFTLFGDPAMDVNLTERPFTDFVYLPIVQKRQ